LRGRLAHGFLSLQLRLTLVLTDTVYNATRNSGIDCRREGQKAALRNRVLPPGKATDLLWEVPLFTRGYSSHKGPILQVNDF
jgi:hypothetical protein